MSRALALIVAIAVLGTAGRVRGQDTESDRATEAAKAHGLAELERSIDNASRALEQAPPSAERDKKRRFLQSLKSVGRASQRLGLLADFLADPAVALLREAKDLAADGAFQALAKRLKGVARRIVGLGPVFLDILDPTELTPDPIDVLRRPREYPEGVVAAAARHLMEQGDLHDEHADLIARALAMRKR